jgi:hypothetical protein
MIRTFQELRRVDPGFTEASNLQTLHIAIPESSIADPRMVTRVENNIADKLASIPGVSSVGFAGAVSIVGLVNSSWRRWLRRNPIYPGIRLRERRASAWAGDVDRPLEQFDSHLSPLRTGVG